MGRLSGDDLRRFASEYRLKVMNQNIPYICDWVYVEVADCGHEEDMCHLINTRFQSSILTQLLFKY